MNEHEIKILQARVDTQGGVNRLQLIEINGLKVHLNAFREALQAIADANCEKTSPIARTALLNEISQLQSQTMK